MILNAAASHLKMLESCSREKKVNDFMRPYPIVKRRMLWIVPKNFERPVCSGYQERRWTSVAAWSLKPDIFWSPFNELQCARNLCKLKNCPNRTNYSLPKGFGLGRFYCIKEGEMVCWVPCQFCNFTNNAQKISWGI